MRDTRTQVAPKPSLVVISQVEYPRAAAVGRGVEDPGVRVDGSNPFAPTTFPLSNHSLTGQPTAAIFLIVSWTAELKKI